MTQGYSGKYNFTCFTHALSRKYNADILVNGVGGELGNLTDLGNVMGILHSADAHNVIHFV